MAATTVERYNHDMNNWIERIGHEELKSFVRAVFEGMKVPPDDAEICSDVIIEADLRGIESHGVNRLKPIYYDRVKAGIQFPRTCIDVLRESPGTAVLDAHHGMGMVASHMAMSIAMEKAKEVGTGMVVVRNSTHYGIAGYYATMATAQNMIGMTGTNARPSIAPTFGVDNMLGTNPLVFGLPTDEAFPFVLDCATSVSQRGKIEVYARHGKELPPGWVIDREGNTQRDPEKVLSMLVQGSAALTPLGGIGEDGGGYKGYGYATVVEVLSSALQGGAFLKALSGFQDGKRVPYSLGHFFMAIDISHFDDPETIKKQTGDILRELRGSEKMPGQERIFTAGEKEHDLRLDREKNGIPVPDAVLMELRSMAEALGLSASFL